MTTTTTMTTTTLAFSRLIVSLSFYSLVSSQSLI